MPFGLFKKKNKETIKAEESKPHDSGKKKVFESDRERIEFGARLVFKGYKIG